MSSETNFAERYRAMSEPELMDLAREYDDLVDEAQTALRAEFAKRGLEPPLVEEAGLPIPDDPEAKLVTVARYRDLPEAVVARAVLEEAGIECLLRDENTVRMDWLWSNLIGGMRLQVAAKDEEAARELLSQPVPKQFAVDSGEEFEQPVCPRCGSVEVVSSDPDRKVLAASMLINIPLPHWRPRGEAWRCLKCNAKWVDEEEFEEQQGTRPGPSASPR
jgi:hypothetical protein